VLEIPEGEAGNGVTLQQPVTLTNGRTYEMALECRFEGSGRANLRINMTKKPWTPHGCSRHLNFEAEWKRYVITFKAREVKEGQ
jgi:hypothetical protein